jgi:hypothetical protein
MKSHAAVRPGDLNVLAPRNADKVPAAFLEIDEVVEIAANGAALGVQGGPVHLVRPP